MSEQNTKSSEKLQAQVAAFAAERVVHYVDRDYIFRNIGDIAAGGLSDLTRLTTDPEYHTEGGEMVRLLENTERAVALTDEYTDFLRSVSGSKSELIAERARMLTEYNTVFKPVISGLREQLQSVDNSSDHPNFLGRGSNSAVFSIDHDGKKYAVRIPSGQGSDSMAIDDHMAGAVLGKGVPHLEQIVAASYEEGVTVAEIMPGKEMGKDMTAEDIRKITDEQLVELVDTLRIARERGVWIDPKPTNVFYDPEVGFGIVDYTAESVTGSSQSLTSLAADIVGGALSNAGFYGRLSDEKTLKMYAEDLKKYEANLDVMERYRKIVEAKLTGQDGLEKVLSYIDQKIQESREIINDYSNPSYVAQEIDRWRSAKEERASQSKVPLDGTAEPIKLDKV